VDQYVLGLNVPVNYVPFLQETQGHHHLGRKSTHHVFPYPQTVALVLADQVLQSTPIAVLDKQKQRSGALLGVNVLQHVGMRYFAQQVDFLQKGVSGDHGGVYRDLFDCEHGGSITFSSPVVAEVDFGHGTLSEHVGVVDLVLVEHQETLL